MTLQGGRENIGEKENQPDDVPCGTQNAPSLTIPSQKKKGNAKLEVAMIEHRIIRT